MMLNNGCQTLRDNFMRSQKYEAVIFDLDGTLLQSDCSVSRRTREALWQCRKKGLLFGVATARSEINALNLLSDLCPDIVISSGGALAKYKGR